MTRFHVDSEAGRLRQVILHRPGLELERLTPSNCEELLFDDVLWPKAAREEHDAFAGALRDRGVKVHLFHDLLAQTLDIKEAREFIAERVITPSTVGVPLAKPLRDLFTDVDSATLATYLVAGLIRSDLPAGLPRSLRTMALTDEDFMLAPLPNHLFTRDTSCWIYNGVSINRMARRARHGETINYQAIYRFHPMFADGDFDVFYGEDPDVDRGPASVEGGDVLVVGNGVLLIGMSERTTPMGIGMLARGLFAKGAATKIVVLELPRQRAFMHLDTVLTMVDRDKFSVYPFLSPDQRVFVLEPEDDEDPDTMRITQAHSLFPTLTDALGLDTIRVLNADMDLLQAEREQWNDGNNLLAVEPGVVFAYERNEATNTMLLRHGIEVVTAHGYELSRGRGGPRCMACPIERDPA
jgi:arginine deiminase